MNNQQKARVRFGAKLVVFILVVYFIARTRDTNKNGYIFPSSVIKDQDPAAYEEGGTAEFTLKLNGVSDDWDMVALSEDMANIAKHEVDEKHTEASILFDVVADGHDMYGHAVQIDAFRLQFSMDDLKQIEWPNVGGKKLLNLAALTNESKVGEEVISNYCAENQESSEIFCAAGVQ
jgi:hypothetical protein